MLLLAVNKNSQLVITPCGVRNPSPVPQACAACASVSRVHLPARCADPGMGNAPSSCPPPAPHAPPPPIDNGSDLGSGFSGSGFSFHSSPKSWHAARQDCQSRGGDLASIHSEAEHREAFALTGGLTHGLGSMTKRTRATMCGRMGRRWTTMGGRGTLPARRCRPCRRRPHRRHHYRHL